MASHNSKNNILLVVLLVIALGVGIYVSHKNKEQAADQGVMCTMEAKLCPDGVTYVGRTGPACEFGGLPGSESRYEHLEDLYERRGDIQISRETCNDIYPDRRLAAESPGCHRYHRFALLQRCRRARCSCRQNWD